MMARDMVNVRSPSRGGRYQAPRMRLGRSQFSLSHQHKTTFDVGRLVPYLVQEVVPGDTFTCRLMAFARIFSPLDAPLMDNIELGIDFFYVPNRLIWDNWTAFLGEHDEAGAQDTDYTVPILTAAGGLSGEDSVAHYMGIPLGIVADEHEINALPIRAYRLIYNEWYRDQNLIDSVSCPKDNGPDTTGELGWNAAPLKSAKKHDYFTSALPYLQKGDAQNVPLFGEIGVRTDATTGSVVSIYQPNADADWRLDADTASGYVEAINVAGSAANRLYVDLAEATQSFTINALREAAAIQRLLERDARGGTRHVEIIRAHFGVDIPDMRAQRPEYIGGGRGFINVSPVAQTSSEGDTENVGTLFGVGTGVLQASWAQSFVEHGWIIGILRARGEVSYSQGLDRKWSRQTRYDFLWPELAHLGEQEILNRELWIEGDSTDDDVFGYQERYAEYRFQKSLITGKFAPDATGALDYWHLSEDFANQPSLNQTFIEDATPMTRVIAVTDEPHFIIDGRFDLRVARALPVRPVPSLTPARF